MSSNIIDKNGSLVGKVTQVGNKKVYYDHNGSITGTIIERKDREDVYDRGLGYVGKLPKHTDPLFPSDD